jgi:maltose O-acetyltransferase
MNDHGDGSRSHDLAAGGRRYLAVGVGALRDEFGFWNPRLSVALAICGMLPPLVGARVRPHLLRLGGIRVGARTVFAGRISVSGGRAPASRLVFGADCFVNEGCRFDTTAAITVDDDVYLGHDVAIITSSHEVGNADRRAWGFLAAPVTIGRGSWIGARSTILPGASVGTGAVVAAGAVVTSDVDDNVMVAGVPARVVRHLPVTTKPIGAGAR